MFHPHGMFCKEIQKLTSTCNTSASGAGPHKHLQTHHRQETARMKNLMGLTNITQPPKFLDICLLTITFFSNWV